jgi:hypothetical protein
MPEHLNGAKDLDRGRLESRTDRYVALPEKTRIYIESLHDDDVVRLALLTDLLREKGGVDRDGRQSDHPGAWPRRIEWRAGRRHIP